MSLSPRKKKSQAPPRYPQLDLPPPVVLNKHFILQEIKENIKDFKQLCPHVDLDVLLALVVRVQNRHVDPEIQAQQFLQAFQKTPEYQAALKELDKDVRDKIRAFTDGKTAAYVTDGHQFESPPSPGVQKFRRTLDKLKALLITPRHTASKEVQHVPAEGEKADRPPILYEDVNKQKVVKAHVGIPFSNWGESVYNTPKYTFVPTTVLGVRNVVKFCKTQNLRVRCGGYRHSWSPIFSSDQEVLVSLLDLNTVNTIPNPLSIGHTSHIVGNELATIERLPAYLNSSGKEVVRVGVAVTGEAFRIWAIKNGVYALPMDAILVE